MIPRLILFDFDYTLFDASGCLFPALRQGLAATGNSAPADEVLKRLIGIPLERQFVELTGNLDEMSYKLFKAAYVKERDLRESAGTHPLPGIMEAIKDLKTKGISLGIVSTGAPKRILRALTRENALSCFGESAVIGGADEKPQAICQALAVFGENAQHTAYIGDRPEDCSAALEAGVSFIAVETGAFQKGDFPRDTIVLSSVAVLPRYFQSLTFPN